ncbi:5-methylcytosine-specific restriction endonuclease system specificity protein McrC [Bacteroidota bacterium]
MKIPIENIYYLLCYSWNKLDEAEQVNVHAKDFTELLDLFAVVLKNGINQLIKRGFDRNYIEYSEDTKRLRGKIDFGISLKKNLLKKAQLHCHYDDLSHNILHNQIIKSTVHNLINIENIDKEIKDELRDLYLKLRGIDLIKIENKHFRMIQLNSNNYFYDFLLNICELIHDNIFIDENSGKFKFKDFIEDDRKMATLFEDFIRNFYKIELQKHISPINVCREDINWDVRSKEESSSKFLPKMQTDISLEFENDKLIIDTKYYQEALQSYYDTEKIISVNLYQILAYVTNISAKGGINTNCRGMLLYPTVHKELKEKVNIQNHDIHFNTINLNQNWQKIHDDLIELVMN